MTNLIRSALVVVALVSATSAVSAATTGYNSTSTYNAGSGAKTFFEQLQRNGN